MSTKIPLDRSRQVEVLKRLHGETLARMKNMTCSSMKSTKTDGVDEITFLVYLFFHKCIRGCISRLQLLTF